MKTHANVVEIVNAIKLNSMCIDKLVKGKNDKIKKDKWSQKKGLKIDIEPEITLNKTQQND